MKSHISSFSWTGALLNSIYSWLSFISLVVRTLAMAITAANLHEESKKPREMLRSVSRDSWSEEVRWLSVRVCETTQALALPNNQGQNIQQRTLVRCCCAHGAEFVFDYEEIHALGDGENNHIWDIPDSASADYRDKGNQPEFLQHLNEEGEVAFLRKNIFLWILSHERAACIKINWEALKIPNGGVIIGKSSSCGFLVWKLSRIRLLSSHCLV